MSRSYNAAWLMPAALAHDLAHTLIPHLDCTHAADGHFCVNALWDLDEQGGAALAAELTRRGWPRRRAESFLRYQFQRYGKEEGHIRREFRRRARHSARLLLYAGRPEEIMEPRHTSGWLTW